jgi:ABC-2 type transport system permease protein
VTTFLTTSSSGVLLEGEDMTEGTYVLGATATEEVDDDTTSRLTVVSSSLIDDDIVGQFGDSVVNLSVFMNTITSGFEDVTNISIEAKSLETPTNTVSNAGLWSLLFLAVLPLTCLGLGIARWWKRRKL